MQTICRYVPDCCIRCGTPSATTASKRPVTFVEKRREGPAVRLPHVRPVRAVVDRHVLPDELPQAACATALAAACAPTAIARSSPTCPASGCRPGKARARWSTATRILDVQKPVDQSLRETSAWLRVTARAAATREARQRRGEIGMSTRRPEPGRHRPAASIPLPGHSSRGRLERVLRRGEFAVTAELNPPDTADPQDVYERAAIFDGWVDAHQRHRRLRRQLPHVVGRHLRAADPHGLCADHADLLPRQEPHRHPGRRARRRGDGRGQHAVPDRRRRAGRRPAGRQAGLRPRLHVAAGNHPHHARRGKVSVGRKLTTPPDVFLGAAINPFAPPYRFPPATGWRRRSPPARSSCRPSTASTCRCSANT